MPLSSLQLHHFQAVWTGDFTSLCLSLGQNGAVVVPCSGVRGIVGDGLRTVGVWMS